MLVWRLAELDVCEEKYIHISIWQSTAAMLRRCCLSKCGHAWIQPCGAQWVECRVWEEQSLRRIDFDHLKIFSIWIWCAGRTVAINSFLGLGRLFFALIQRIIRNYKPNCKEMMQMQMSSRTIPTTFHFLNLTAVRSSLLSEYLTGLKSFVLKTSLMGNIEDTIINIAQPFKLYTKAGFSTRCLLVLGSYSILYNVSAA